MKIIIYIYLISLLVFPFTIRAQEFTLKKSPEEAKWEKILQEEKQYLEFQEHFFNAIQQKAKEDYNKAIEELEICKQIYPNDIGLNFEFAKNYFSLKDFENAIFFDNKALKENPKNTYILEHLKNVYRKQRDYDSAIDIQKKIIAINPKKKEDLISLYIGSRQKTKAKALFIEMQENNETVNNEAYYKRIFFRKTKSSIKPTKTTVSKTKPSTDTNYSIKNLKKRFIKDKSYKTLKQLLLEEEKQGKYDLLVNDSKKGLELFPAQPYIYLMQGIAEIKTANSNNAIEVLKAGLEYLIDNNVLEAKFYTQLSKAYLAIGNTLESSKYLDKATKLNK